MLGWSIRARAWRSASKRRSDLGRVHARLDDLQGDAALDRLGLLGHPDGAHAALAEFLQQLVGPDARADRFAGPGTAHPCPERAGPERSPGRGQVRRRLSRKSPAWAWACSRRSTCAAQVGVPPQACVQEGGALLGRALAQGGQEMLFDDEGRNSWHCSAGRLLSPPCAESRPNPSPARNYFPDSGCSAGSRRVRRRARCGHKPSSARRLPARCPAPGPPPSVSPAKKRSFTSRPGRGFLRPAGRGLRRGPAGRIGRYPGRHSVEVGRHALPAAAVLAAAFARAFSTRMRRMASAAAAKKWPRPSQPCSGPRRPAAGRPRGPGQWPGASGPASPGPVSGRPASAAPRRPAAATARRRGWWPCAMSESKRVTSFIAGAQKTPRCQPTSIPSAAFNAFPRAPGTQAPLVLHLTHGNLPPHRYCSRFVSVSRLDRRSWSGLLMPACCHTAGRGSWDLSDRRAGPILWRVAGRQPTGTHCHGPGCMGQRLASPPHGPKVAGTAGRHGADHRAQLARGQPGPGVGLLIGGFPGTTAPGRYRSPPPRRIAPVSGSHAIGLLHRRQRLCQRRGGDRRLRPSTSPSSRSGRGARAAATSTRSPTVTAREQRHRGERKRRDCPAGTRN